MAKKSKGYIWLRKRTFNKSTHDKKEWVGKRICEITPILGLKTTKEIRQRLRINEKPIKFLTFFYKLRPEDRLEVLVSPTGGDGFGFFVDIALIVAGSLIPGAQFLIAVGLSSLASRILTPKAKRGGSVQQDETRQRPEITGAQNEISKSIVNIVCGETKLTPTYGTNAFRWTGDGTAVNFLNQYFIPTYNNINISDEKLGETPILDFENNLVSTKEFGSSVPIYFENIFPTVKDEQLTKDDKSITNDILTTPSAYNGTVSIQFTLNYTTLTSISDFSDKVIRVSGANGGSYQDITITSSDLVDNTTFYSYTAPAFNLAVVSEAIKFENLEFTQQSSAEESEDLRGTFISFGIDSVETNANVDFDKIEGQPSFVVDTSPEDCIGIEWVFSFQQGLFRQNNDGSRANRSINARCRYKIKGTLSYSDLEDGDSIYVRNSTGGKLYLSDTGGGVYTNAATTTTYDSTTNQITFTSPDDTTTIDELFFRNIGIEVAKEQYTYNVSSNGFVGGKTSSDIGSIVLSDVFFGIDGEPVNNDILTKITQIKLTAQAYKNLSGTLQQYNFVANAKMPTWDGSDWDTIAETKNPASVIRYLLTDTNANPRADSVDLLDNDSFAEFYSYCATEGFVACGVISEESKVLAVIQTILENCQSALTIIDGKLGIVSDKAKDVVDMITPHNSFDISVNYNIGKKTDALRLSYVNKDDYKEDVKEFYYYNNTSSTTPEMGKDFLDYEGLKKEIEFTNETAHILKKGEYDLKTIQERVVELEFKTNLEGLGLNIFDRVLVSDTTNTGSEYSGRIKEVVRDGSGLITGFKLYSYIDLLVPENGTYYKIYIRSIEDLGSGEGRFVVNSLDVEEQDGRFIELSLLTPYDDSLIVKGAGVLSYITADGYYDGDLFDINDTLIRDCIITDIRPEQDLTFTITALETKQEFYT